MPAITANARNFLYNTDYPLDKVIYLKSGTTNIASGGTLNIAHGLPFIPLINFYWSLTPDFSVIYEDNIGPFPSGNPGFFFTLQVSARADATNITLDANGILGSTTIYYRIFGFQPDDSNVDLPSTASAGDIFSFNTDYNYLKLYSASHVSLAAGASFTLVHGLGYRPQVSTWFLTGGVSYPSTYSDQDGRQTEVTNSSVIFTNASFSAGVMYYRIYQDGQA